MRSLLAVDYPQEKLELVVVNDGSTDGTLARRSRSVADGGAARARDRLPREPRQARRDGGRDPRDRAPRSSRSSTPTACSSPNALRSLVQGFADEKVGAIAGHADVAERARVLDHAHAGGALLRRVPGRARRPSRSSARSPAARAASRPTGAARSCRALEQWEHQTFLGPPATYGDDRSLTNYVLRDWKRDVRVDGDSAARSCRPTSGSSCASSCAGSAAGRASR